MVQSEQYPTNVEVLELLSLPQDTHAHSILCHCVRHVILEPYRVHVQRGRVVEYVCVRRFLEVGQASLGHTIRSSSVDTHHQIKPVG